MTLGNLDRFLDLPGEPRRILWCKPTERRFNLGGSDCECRDDQGRSNLVNRRCIRLRRYTRPVMGDRSRPSGRVAGRDASQQQPSQSAGEPARKIQCQDQTVQVRTTDAPSAAWPQTLIQGTTRSSPSDSVSSFPWVKPRPCFVSTRVKSSLRSGVLLRSFDEPFETSDSPFAGTSGNSVILAFRSARAENRLCWP